MVPPGRLDGARAKAITLRRDLEQAGISAEKRASFHCPIGLSIGSRHPHEIAVSIVSQMIQVRDEHRKIAKDYNLRRP